MVTGFPECRVLPLVAPGTREERARARLTAARFARDTDDLRLILSALDLWPRGDHAGVTTDL